MISQMKMTKRKCKISITFNSKTPKCSKEISISQAEEPCVVKVINHVSNNLGLSRADDMESFLFLLLNLKLKLTAGIYFT